MKITRHKTPILIELSPKDYWLVKLNDDDFRGEYKLTHRIDMSYKGKPDQEGSDFMFLSDEEADQFRKAGFDELL